MTSCSTLKCCARLQLLSRVSFRDTVYTTATDRGMVHHRLKRCASQGLQIFVVVVERLIGHHPHHGDCGLGQSSVALQHSVMLFTREPGGFNRRILWHYYLRSAVVLEVDRWISDKHKMAGMMHSVFLLTMTYACITFMGR